MVEDLEARVLRRVIHDVAAVRVEREPRWSPPVHVHDHLHVRRRPDVLRIGGHRRREAMHALRDLLGIPADLLLG